MSRRTAHASDAAFVPRSARPWMVGRRWSVAARRVLVRHPSIHWAVVVVLAIGVAASLRDHTDAVEAERDTWGGTGVVLIADRAIAPGDPLLVTPRVVPLAVVPDRPLAADHPGVDDLVARQHVSGGEIVTVVDVVAGGELALVPAGWLAVAIVESPASGAELGDRVRLASDGVVVADEAIVVGHHDDVTLVAVPAGLAPSVPPAAAAGSLAVLRVP